MTTKQRIDVFISSTSLDLPEYRRAVSEAIVALGLFPSGMETWAVRDEDAIQLCKRKIDEAEIYLGIYAYRYGWTPDGYDGRSITELEYDWATARGIPRLRFIMADTHPWPESEKQHEAQAALNAFKTRLKEKGNIVGFFTTPDDLKAQVIGALAGYAPQVSAAPLTPYLRALHHASAQSGLLRALDPRTNDPSYGGRGVTVDQVYVPLDMRQRVRRDTDETILSGYLGDEGKPDEGRTPLTAMEAANGIHNLVVLGDPGSGKSTFVNYLTLCLTGALLDPESDWLARLEHQGWRHGALYPVVVVLRDFAQSVDVGAAPTANTLWNYIEREVVGVQAPDSAAALRALAHRGAMLYLLDGLDEVPGERRAFVRDAIDRFVAAQPPLTRFVTTCRILSYADPTYHIPAFISHTIAPLNDEQIAAFIGTWYAALIALGSIDRETAAQRVKDLNDAISRQVLTPLAANPMLLTVMALVHNHLGTLPRETARLYSQCVELLLLKWRPHDARALIDLLEITEGDLVRLVWAIAFDAHDQQAEREGTADITQHAVEMIARRFLNDDAAKGQAFCEYVEKRAGLLIGRGFDRYGGRIYTFPHRTFQEYLAGCHISSNRFTREAVEYARRGAAWRETLLLATGQLIFNDRKIDIPIDAVRDMLDSAEARATDADWRLYPLAGEMLLLVGLDNLERDRHGKKALDAACAGLAALVEGGHLPVLERAAAGRVLGQIGDPRPGVGLRPDGLPDIAWCEVPGGEFIYQDGERLTLPTFQIARYPVTNAQFQTFLDDPDGFVNPAWWMGMGRYAMQEMKSPSWDIPNHPRESVSWYQAVAFTRWLTARLRTAGALDAEQMISLPTEGQWEKAARGSDGRVYPYRGGFDADKGNTKETGIAATSAVGIFPAGASPYGALDMSGNVSEWCLTKYDSPDVNTVDDSTDVRVLRGGSWGYTRDYARASFRSGSAPDGRGDDIGFRVVVGGSGSYYSPVNL